MLVMGLCTEVLGMLCGQPVRAASRRDGDPHYPAALPRKAMGSHNSSSWEGEFSLKSVGWMFSHKEPVPDCGNEFFKSNFIKRKKKKRNKISYK